MEAPAFYLPSDRWAEPALEGASAAHARALRLCQGDEVTLLDGQGKTALCRVANIRKKIVVLTPESESETPPPKARAIMAIALSKAARRGFFMEKAAELGAFEIWLWQAARSQGKLADTTISACRAKLVAGMEQSRNPWLPRLRAFENAGEIAQAANDAEWKILPWEAQCGLPMLAAADIGREGRSVYVIGPEGGFEDWEVDALREAGFMAASLGQRALRCETAATLCLGLHWWASQLPGHPGFHGHE